MRSWEGLLGEARRAGMSAAICGGALVYVSRGVVGIFGERWRVGQLG